MELNSLNGKTWYRTWPNSRNHSISICIFSEMRWNPNVWSLKHHFSWLKCPTFPALRPRLGSHGLVLQDAARQELRRHLAADIFPMADPNGIHEAWMIGGNDWMIGVSQRDHFAMQLIFMNDGMLPPRKTGGYNGIWMGSHEAKWWDFTIQQTDMAMKMTWVYRCPRTWVESHCWMSLANTVGCCAEWSIAAVNCEGVPTTCWWYTDGQQARTAWAAGCLICSRVSGAANWEHVMFV